MSLVVEYQICDKTSHVIKELQVTETGGVAQDGSEKLV